MEYPDYDVDASALFTNYVNQLGLSLPGAPNDWVLPPTVGEAKEHTVYGRMHLYILNPYSDQKELAIRYLECAAQTMTDEMRIQMSPKDNSPVPDQDWELRKSQLVEFINSSDTELNGLDGQDKLSLMDEIDKAKAELDANQERWEISAKQIAAYQQVAPYIDFAEQSLYLSSYNGLLINDFYQIIMRYLEGQIDLDETIRILDSRTQQIYLEAN